LFDIPTIESGLYVLLKKVSFPNFASYAIAAILFTFFFNWLHFLGATIGAMVPTTR
jgi:hypothetical protein